MNGHSRSAERIDDTKKNELWGGRFAEGPSAVMKEINASIRFDQRLAAQDIAGSKAHCLMLEAKSIISSPDAAAIMQGLEEISREIASGQFEFSLEREDIHLNIEARLAEKIGDAAGRLHTARSRNDQVATDFRLWVRDALDELDRALQLLQKALIEKAEPHTETLLPGFTHLQSAQPVSFAHHLLAYVEMLGRDRRRVRDARAGLNECPLGSAALAGTPFPIDRHMTAQTLGFDQPMANSLDGVSDRDFALEYLFAASVAGIHLSRLSEELVLWCSEPFSFIRLSDAYTTGSSIMPQKRNPDAAELVRAKTGRLTGALNGLMMAMKGLPLAYSKDMQEDKEPVFLAHDTLALCLSAMTGMVSDLEPRPEEMRRAAEKGFPTATDLADWLVRSLNLPFRRAHHVTGEIVRKAEDAGCALKDLPLSAMQQVEPDITADVYSVLGIDASAMSRQSHGGTSPLRVKEAISAAKQRFLDQ